MKKALALTLAAAMSAGLLAGCSGGETSGTAGGDSGETAMPAYNELTVGEDYTDLTAELRVISHRTDLIQDGTFQGYVDAFNEMYPNITISYEGITDYASDMTTRLTSNDWGDICMIPTTIPLPELSDYFYAMCDLSAIQDTYNFADNRAYDARSTASPPPATPRASSTTRPCSRPPASPSCPRRPPSSWTPCRPSRTTPTPSPCTPTLRPAGP